MKSKFINKVFLLLMLIVFSILGTTDAWAGGSSTTYYSKLSASVNPTGAGVAYVNTSNSQSNEISKTTDNTSTSHTYNIFATPNTGWSFKNWSATSATVSSNTAANTSATVSGNSNSNSRTDGKVTANFVQIFQFKAKADFVTGSAGMGQVAVSFASGSPDYKDAAATDTDTQLGAETTTANATKTAHFHANPNTGKEFRGWYSDAAGTVKVSDDAALDTAITSATNDAGLSPQLTLYAKFEKVPTAPTWALYGTAGTTKTLEIGETVALVTNTAGDNYSWGTPSYVDAGETNPVMSYNPATKTFTANRAGTVTVRFTQVAGDANDVLWTAGEQTFTFTVEKLTPEFAWADPLPHFTVGTTLPVSELFSFTPAEAEQNWTLTSSNTTCIANIAAPATGLVLSKEADGVTLTFHQDATWKWKEIANTSIKINVTKEPVVFNWKKVALIAGHTYNWSDIVETNSEGAWNLMSDDESVIPTMRSIANTSATVSSGTVTLTFTQGQDLGHDAVPIQTKTFEVYPASATYLANSKSFTDLQAAIAEANGMSRDKYVFVASDGVVLPGTYNIPSGVTLVVPYESTNSTSNITEPKVLANSTLPIEAYRTLKLVDGVTINVNGAICVNAQLQSGDASHNPTGFPVGPVGVIDMSKGGDIVVKSGGNLYTWGFIKGEGYLDGNNTTHVGKVTAENGSTIWECFAMGDWGGGSFTMAAGSNSASYKIFPFQSYFVQNIEIPLHMKYGAQEKLYTNFYGNGGTNKSSVTFISYDSNTALFLVNSNSGSVTKRYDPTTDHMVVDLEGDSKLGALSIKVLTTSVNSSGFDMPIVNNMHIRLIDCDLTLTTPIRMFPGSVLEVTRGSKLTVSTNVFMHDHDDWEKTVNKHYFGVTPKILSPHVALGDNIDVNTLEDAKMIVDGDVVISSKGIFTSPAGANIMGNGGGTFKWTGALPADTKVYAYTLGNTVEGSNFSSKLKTEGIVTTTCNPAKLHNDNDSYTAAVGSKTFYNVKGRWFVQDDKDEKSDHTYNFKYLNDGNTVATPAVYASDKTGLMGGYKWVNVALDNDFCGSKTFLGEDGNYYYYDGASKDAASKWVQLVKLNDALYSGSDNNLYTFTGCAWASVGEIGDDCMYTLDKDTPSEHKAALVGTEFIAIEKDEYDEVYVDASGNYYMLFDGCVWQHATKIPDTYKAYEVLGNPYIWMGEEWVEVAAEGAYFYTTDDQSIKHYYEFNNTSFTWVPVRNKVRITTPTGDRRDFLSFDDAIAYLSQYNNPTVTLLEDATATKAQTFAPGSKSTTATIDLNGHTVTANVGTAGYVLDINTSATVTITDNSDKQNGELRLYSACNIKDSRFEGIRLTKGSLNIEGGKIYAENTLVYASDDNHKYAFCAAIRVYAGQSLTINGGEVEAKATRNAYAVYASNSAATQNTSIVTINGGTITGIAPVYAYGVYSYGNVMFNDGTINARTEEINGVAAANYAYGIYLNISVNAVDANSYHATLNMTGGTINATAATSSSYGIFANATYTSAWGKGDDNKTDNTKKPSDGTHSNKASARIDVSGGTINVTSLTSTAAYGIYKLGGENSYTDKSETGFSPDYIRNVKIDAKATANAYGIFITAAVGDFHAGKLIGKAVVENVDVRAEATLSTGAYAAYVSAANIWINRARFRNQSAANRKLWYVTADAGDKDIEHGAIAATGGTNVYPYQIGSYAVGAEMTINSGNFYAKTFTTSAYGVYVNRSASPYDNTEGLATCIINGGTFTAETTTDTGYGLSSGGNTTVNGGTFNALTGTSTAYGIYAWGGTTTVNNCTVNATGTTSTAYAVAAGGTIDTNVGTHAHGTLIVKDGVFNARALNTSTAFGAYAIATNAEMNRTNYNARSASNKQQYFALKEDGTIDVHATNASTTSGYFQDFYPYRYGQYTEGGVVHVYGGTFKVKTFTTTAVCAGATWSNMVRTTELGRLMVARGEMNVHGGTFTAETETGSTAECIRSYGTVNVDGGTFTAIAATNTAYGVRTLDGTTTIDGGTFNIIAKDNTAYGARSEYEFNTSYGYYGEGNIVINGGTFNVNTWKGGTTYGVQATGTNAAYTASSVTKDEAGNAIVKPANYACAGRLTVNGGTFTMNPADGTNSYGVVASATQTRGTGDAQVTAYPKAEVNGGFFKMLGTGVYAAGTSATEDAEGNPNIWIKGGHFSTKANLEQASPKDYVRDPYNIIACVHPDYKKDYPFEVAEVCTITFKDDEDNTLWSGKQPKGTMAIYPLTNGVPEKTATADNSFEFASWDTPLATITGDATYTASFNTVAKKYMVTWQDENGNEIDHLEWASGQTPTHADPVKEGYTFTGWKDVTNGIQYNPGDELTAVAGANQTYKATFTINTFTIRFEDEDGTLLKEQVVNYGVKPTAPANPTKDGYSFQTWNPGVVIATEDVTYQASYLLNIASVTDASTGKTTNYTSWSGAVTAANKLTVGGTLTLLTDMYGQGAQTITKSMTIDLNGHILSGTATKLIQVNAAGINVRMVDSQGGGQLRVSAAATSELDAVYVNNGTFTLESGTIYCENVHATANDNYRGVGVYVVAGMDFVMTGGRVESYNQQCNYAIYGMGRVNISGGEVVSTARTKARGLYLTEASTLDNVDVLATATTTENAVAVMVANNKTPIVTINGGHYKAVAKTTNACALNGYTTNTINVNGGVFEAEAPTAAYGIKFQVTTSAINFNAGKIKATTAPVDNVAPATKMKFYGGYFDKDVNLATYVVSPKKVVTLNPVNDADAMAEGYNYKIVDAAYQVTFKAENGTVLQLSNIEAGIRPAFLGEAQTKPSTPKYAYEFDGWMDDSDSHVYTETDLPAASKDVVYTAHFAQRAVEYPITFSNIDGKGTDYVQMVAYDEMPVYAGPTPYMSGAVSNYAYTFIGWDPELAVVAGPASYSPRYDLVISHNVSFVINNASAVTPTTLVVAEGAAVERPADQLVDCQHIAGWYKDAGLTEEWNFASDKLGEEDLILYAKWKTKTYTITWLDEFGDEIDQTVVNCGVVPTHANLYKPSTAAYSYEWKGWNKTIVAADADATYKSLGFTQVAKRYAITFNTNGGSSIAPIEQEVGSAIVAPADPTREGYTFAGWDKAIPTEMPAEDMTITASWTVNQYTITFNSNGGSAIAPISGNYGDPISAPADPTRKGYTFAGWDADIPSTMPASDMTINANWTASWKLMGNWDSYTENAVTLQDGQLKFTKQLEGNTTYWVRLSDGIAHAYRIGRDATMTKENCTNWNFYEDNSVDVGIQTTAPGDYTFIVDDSHCNNDDSNGARLVVSVIYPASVLVTFNLQSKGDNVSTYITPNTVVTEPTAPAADGFIFGGWYEDAECTNAWNFETTISANKTLYAKWTAADSWNYHGDWESGGFESAYPMTRAANGQYYYQYTYKSGDNRLFKIEKDGTWYGYTFNQPGFNGTDITIMNSSSNFWNITGIGDKCAVNYNVKDRYYIIVYVPHTLANPTSDPIICASTFLPAEVTEMGTDLMDIVDWSTDSVILNMNGYGSNNGQSWGVKVNNGTKLGAGNRAINRTLRIKTDELIPNTIVRIDVYGGDELENIHGYKVPYIYTENTTLNAQVGDATSILYVKSGTLTIDADVTVAKVIVCPGAELVVNGTLKTTDLVLRGKAWGWEQPKLTGSVTATHTYYTRIVTDKSAYYPFGLPFASKVEDVRLSNGVKPSFGETSNWNLKYYDGEARANGEDGWTNLEEDKVGHNTTIAAKTYYLIGSGSAYYREYYFPITLGEAQTEMLIEKYPSTKKEEDAGWNGLCSPFTTVYSAHAAEPDDNVNITIKNSDNRTWTQDVAEQIYPFFPFFYQSAGAGKLNFGDNYFSFAAAETPESVAARAQAEETQKVHTQWVQVRLTNDRGEQDKLNLYVHPSKFTSGYERRYDLSKMLGEGSERPQVYTEMACGKLAFNALPDSVAATRIPVGVVPGTATELTFSLGREDYLDRVEAINLIDTELGTTTNLLFSDYTWSTEDGTNGRFYLNVELRRVQQTPTSLDDLESVEALQPQKVIINDMLYILVGERVYDAAGKVVK